MTEPIKPVVGMGGTHQVGSDSYPYTIIEVSASGKTIKAQRDIAHRTDSNGWSESQTYKFERNPEGEIATFTLRNNGNYHQKGQEGHYHAFYPGGRSIIMPFFSKPRRELYHAASEMGDIDAWLSFNPVVIIKHYFRKWMYKTVGKISRKL